MLTDVKRSPVAKEHNERTAVGSYFEMTSLHPTRKTFHKPPVARRTILGRASPRSFHETCFSPKFGRKVLLSDVNAESPKWYGENLSQKNSTKRLFARTVRGQGRESAAAAARAARAWCANITIELHEYPSKAEHGRLNGYRYLWRNQVKEAACQFYPSKSSPLVWIANSSVLCSSEIGFLRDVFRVLR